MFSATSTLRRLPRTLFALSGIALCMLPGVAGAAARSISSFALTQGAGAPVISDFSPDGGPWKTTVTITGTGFTGVSSVRFNGKEAPISGVSDTTITVRVPSGAGVGPIRVANAAGADVSDRDFQFRRIRHRLVLKMHLEDHLVAIGRVTVPNAGARARFECAVGRRVTIKRKISGVFRSVAHGESEGIEGRFQIALTDREGNYRAIIRPKLTPNRKCLPDRSVVLTHEHA